LTDTFTIRNERRDFPEWHLGRPRYALWALDLDLAAVRQRVDAAQVHMADYLLDGYRRQPHVTLGVCGFPSDSPVHADDFGAESLQAHLAALRVARPAPFEIHIGNLDTFSSVPYFTVDEPRGQLASIRQCITHNASHAPHAQYTAHVTVGLYAAAWPMQAVQSRLDTLRFENTLRVRVTGMSLLAYEATEISGPLQTLAHFDFETAALKWQGRPAFEPWP
jgi:2'-5' RNA ligase